MDGMNTVAPGSGPPHDPSMEARVAVLEEIAGATKDGVLRLGREVHDLRDHTDRRFDAVRDRLDTMRDMQERDFRILFGSLITTALGLAALMAKGFHWF